MRVLVLANRVDPETGYVGEALAAHGASLDQAWRDATDPLPSVGEHDLVLTLGSDWSVYWPERADEVEREARYLRGCFDAGVPVLGICYGAQILAHALGGGVEAAPGVGEVGWYVVDTDEPSAIPAGPYLQWHSDRVVLPPDAVELARSPVGSQAFRVEQALGLQFHPETTPDVVARWSVGAEEQLARFGLDPASLTARSRAEAPGAQERAHHIVDAFLTSVGYEASEH